MAKDGGGAHYDERLREAGYYDRPRRKKASRAASTGRADSSEVLSAITKPRAKPVVVVKKKPKHMPMLPGRKLAKTIPGLRMGAAQAEVRVKDLSRKRDLGPFDDQIVTSSLKANRRTKGDLEGQMVNEYASTRGDREPDNTGSLFGFLRDPSDVPLTSRLRRRG